MHRSLRTFIASQTRLVLATAVFAAAMLLSSSARAQFCFPQTLQGHWVNVNPSTRSITRADISCIPFIQHWTVHLWGRCHPTDCDWGTVAATASAPPIVLNAFYDQGFAKRYVVIRQVLGGRINIRIRTDFVDPRRRDYVSSDIMRRVP